MIPKKKLFKLIEKYVNFLRSKEMELIYGKGSKLKVHSISESVKHKTILIECIVIFGDIIEESMLDESAVDLYVRESIKDVFPNAKIQTMVRWDS